MKKSSSIVLGTPILVDAYMHCANLTFASSSFYAARLSNVLRLYHDLGGPVQYFSWSTWSTQDRPISMFFN
jgi:hypothetical protein